MPGQSSRAIVIGSRMPSTNAVSSGLKHQSAFKTPSRRKLLQSRLRPPLFTHTQLARALTWASPRPEFPLFVALAFPSLVIYEDTAPYIRRCSCRHRHRPPTIHNTIVKEDDDVRAAIFSASPPRFTSGFSRISSASMPCFSMRRAEERDISSGACRLRRSAATAEYWVRTSADRRQRRISIRAPSRQTNAGRQSPARRRGDYHRPCHHSYR